MNDQERLQAIRDAAKRDGANLEDAYADRAWLLSKLDEAALKLGEYEKRLEQNDGAIESYQNELMPLRITLRDCEPYLKEGETPAQCIERNRMDANMVLEMLADERTKCEGLESRLGSCDVLIERILARAQSESGNTSNSRFVLTQVLDDIAELCSEFQESRDVERRSTVCGKPFVPKAGTWALQCELEGGHDGPHGAPSVADSLTLITVGDGEISDFKSSPGEMASEMQCQHENGSMIDGRWKCDDCGANVTDDPAFWGDGTASERQERFGACPHCGKTTGEFHAISCPTLDRQPANTRVSDRRDNNAE